MKQMRPNHVLAEQREENLPPCDNLSPNSHDAAPGASPSWCSEQIQPRVLRIGPASGSGSGILPDPERARLESLIGSWNGTLIVQEPLCGAALEIAAEIDVYTNNNIVVEELACES